MEYHRLNIQPVTGGSHSRIHFFEQFMIFGIYSLLPPTIIVTCFQARLLTDFISKLNSNSTLWLLYSEWSLGISSISPTIRHRTFPFRRLWCTSSCYRCLLHRRCTRYGEHECSVAGEESLLAAVCRVCEKAVTRGCIRKPCRWPSMWWWLCTRLSWCVIFIGTRDVRIRSPSKVYDFHFKARVYLLWKPQTCRFAQRKWPLVRTTLCLLECIPSYEKEHPSTICL